FLLLIPRPPISTLFPYTTLFRSLVIMIAAYDAGSSQFPVFHPYPDVAYYALTARNAWGAVGFRKDQWGAKDEYLKKIAELNSKSDRKSTRLNSSHVKISYAVFCL